jgi:mRNA interferase HigB
MKRILAKSTLRAFWELYPDSKIYLQTWYEIAVHAVWKSPDEIKQVFANASILKDNRVVFNIKGNQYRLVVKINYSKQWMFIRFIGTHSAYDRIDANTI